MVTNFKAGKDGSRVDLVRSTHNILEALKAGYSQGSLSISKAPASTKLSDTNSLGIKELLATGTSTFAGSPNNRRHNIKIGVEHMTGILVAPGEEFSFNKFLGPVEEEFGFLPELVIKKEGTIPELGGGLCQVSSTLFRSVMKAGLPVTQRKNHSYAVQYYAPQGTDATIYPGVIDLKFMNDTPGHLLIWPYFKDKNTLLFELYGTRDNRLVQLDTPIQYDRKTDGSMKAMWKRVVINNGKTKTDEFFSNYLPPALFHKEEQFPKPTTEKPTATETNSEVKTETETNGENTESSTETKPENKPETTAPDKEQS
jgi:vancomycin resistance protein YoaR